ncbi:DUF4174 domain-containing protein [Sphingomonas sp.]|uniref:DUF4174 domain-containing protein n=1 Tax=Sphingomonas sp. TaxID=28214 RepID=UPI003B3A5F35
MKIVRDALLALVLLAIPAAAGATTDDLRSVAGMQSHNSALLVFAPSLSDPRLIRQHAIFAQLAVQAARHDLLFVQIDPTRVIGSHDTSRALHRRFQVPPDTFRVILINKNGKMVASAVAPVAGSAIIRRLDAPN